MPETPRDSPWPWARQACPNAPPGFPDFGFDMDSPREVLALRARLVADGIELVEEEDTETYVGFKCLDPDRHVMEVSWEPEVEFHRATTRRGTRR